MSQMRMQDGYSAARLTTEPPKYKKMVTGRKHKGWEKQNGDTYSEYNSKSCSPESRVKEKLRIQERINNILHACPFTRRRGGQQAIKDRATNI
jgi:hypothetical protein